MLYYFEDTNIAFNKPATASSIFACESCKNKYWPQLVTNGQSVCDNKWGPIAHTKKAYHQWFKVDLRGTFYIKTVVVNLRKSKFIYKTEMFLRKRPKIGRLLFKQNCVFYLTQYSHVA